ncbi:MAG: hypothetical protein ACC662_02065 [Planctomycetota bacterium]
MRARLSEVRTGFVVLLAVAVLLAFLFYATGGAWMKEYRHVLLRIEPGPLAPREGDPVFLNGLEVGKTQAPFFRMETGTEGGEEGSPGATTVREIYVYVVAELDAARTLPDGTSGLITEGLTGSRSLRLILGRSLEDLSDADTQTNPIFVRQSPDLSRIADRFNELADQAGLVVKDISKVASAATDLLAEAKATVVSIRSRIEHGEIDQILEDLAATAASLKRTARSAESLVDGIRDDVSAASADVRRITAGGVRIVNGVETDVAVAMKSVKEATRKIDTLVGRVGPRIDGLLDDVDQVGRNLVALSQDLKERIPGIAQDFGRDLDALMDELMDTGRNLADASEDVRAHPWKLMNEPSGDVIAHENLRVTMQNYVRAMKRADRAAATLRDLAARPGPADERTRALIARAVANLENSLDRYHEVESRLMDLLGKNLPAAATPRAPAAPPPSPPPVRSTPGR